MKKFLIFILVILFVGFGIWWFFFRPNTSPENVPGIFKPLFPKGEQVVPVDTSEGDEPVGDSQTGENRGRLTQITTVPIAGFTLYQEQREVKVSGQDGKITTQKINDEVLRYVHRKSGYIFERRNNEDAVQVSNIFLANIYEVVFGDSGKSAALRFLQDDAQTIGTYVVPIPDPKEDGTREQKQGLFLVNNIEQFVKGPGMRNHARLTVSGENGVITTASFNNKNVSEVLRFPFTEWILQWPLENTLYVQTKASARIPGYLYSINTKDKILKRVLGNINGLTTNVSPSGSYIIYSQSTQERFTTYIYNTKTAQFFRLDPYILPEKCVWTQVENLICAGSSNIAASAYPDSWYAGLIKFTDSFYRISVGTGLIETVFEPVIEDFDATNLHVDPREEYLYFTDKTTGILWRLLL